MGNFVKLEQDGFNPEFGDIVWRRRLNQRLEERVKELEKIAWEMLRHGHKKIGIQACIEIFRWETRRHTISKDFKINNNFASRYARMIHDRNPHWGQVFELRALKS